MYQHHPLYCTFEPYEILVLKLQQRLYVFLGGFVDIAKNMGKTIICMFLYGYNDS